MPSYNCGQYLIDSISSVQAQTYKNWELIVVDDCSTDGSWERLKKLCGSDSRIIPLKNDSNIGAALSRNRALRHAKGKWIAFLDSDDLWEPNKLEKQLAYMKQENISFSYSYYQEIDCSSKFTGVTVTGPKRVSYSDLLHYCWLGCLTVVYDAESIGLVQIRDIRKNNCYAMWLEVGKKADCYLLPEVLAKYRRGRSGSVSSHSIFTMIGWHYKLWHEAENKNVIVSLWLTAVNLLFGFYKKVKYVKKIS